MLRNCLPLYLSLLLSAAACDNVGLAFDPSVDPNTPVNEVGESEVQVVPVGGDARDGRPLVRQVYPDGSGWPSTVPIVVEFSESINRASIFPTSQNGIDGRIGVRIRGTGQLLPASYDLLGGGKLLIIRPLTPLPNEGAPIYEVVLFPESRDVDGIRFLVNGSEKLLGDFQVNQGASITDGAILAIFPRDNFGDQPRENDFFVVFDKPANAATLTSANLAIAPEGGQAIAAEIDTPLSVLGIDDPRIVQLRPDDVLDASQRYEFTVTEDVTFGQNGNLEFNGATPFSVFDTVAPAPPELVELASPQAGFDNRININNIETVQLAVTPPADALAGDTVVARIYGGDADTSPTFDEAFIERSGTVTDPTVPVVIDFSGALGNAASPKLDEGGVTFVAQMRRGGDRSGYIHNDAGAGPSLDVTPPTLVSTGPPGSGNDIYTDCASLAYYGVASEALAAATLTIDDGSGSTAELAGSSGAGRFLMLSVPNVVPPPVTSLTLERAYTITLTDSSGNPGATTFGGTVVQRGALTGAVAGSLDVRVFDQATLLPVADATVLVDPAVPDAGGIGQLVGTTDQSGVATFATALPSHTITVIHPDFDLISMFATSAADVSLPLTATGDATATLSGSVFFDPATGAAAIVGSSAAADPSVMGTPATSGPTGASFSMSIVPNRAQVVTTFGGGFEPTAVPAYALSGCQLCGPTFLDPTAPPRPVGPGETTNVNLVLLPVPPVISPNLPTDPSLLAPVSVDFGGATGLDLADLVGGAPKARATLSLGGFAGQALAGIGVMTSVGGGVYAVDANYSLPIINALNGFNDLCDPQLGPCAWLVSEAEDSSGRVARTRALVLPLQQTTLPGSPAPMAIPTVTGGTFTGAPEVSFEDVVDEATVIDGLGITDLTITDPNDRAWLVLVSDGDDASGQNIVQLPSVSSSLDPGLALGGWSVVAESRVFIATGVAGVEDLVLTDRFRKEVSYSRSAAATLTVN